MAENSPAPPAPPADSAPRLLRFFVRVWGVIAALCTISTGLFALITITGKCFAAGLLQIFFGLTVICLEAPVLFSFSEVLTKLSNWVESNFRFWLRACFYLVLGIPPIVLCFGTSTFIGSGSVVVLAALYGLLAIGKKGGDDQLSKNDAESTEKLINNEENINQNDL